MTVTNLLLVNFRSWAKKEFSFSPQVTIIIGPNAAGKTNILEALYLLALGRSFHAENDREMIGFGKETGRVRCEITSRNSGIHDAVDAHFSQTASGQSEKEEIELEVLLTTGLVMGIKTQLKKYTVNGVAKRMLDFVGKLKVVLFWPEDLELVTDSPSFRRHYLDYVLMQTDSEYRRNIHSYEKGLRQRNKVLEAIRDNGAHRHQLLFWDQLIIKSGEYITKKREEYIEFINKLETGNPKLEDVKYKLFYDKSIISRSRLDEYSREEVAAASTLVGPHRDDFSFSLRSTLGVEARNLSHFGSRGEQRLGILWLKLAELTYIEHVTGDKPVLLLDDIFSELDHEHRKIIFDIIGNQQIIMTTTDLHFLENARLKNAKMIEL